MKKFFKFLLFVLIWLLIGAVLVFGAVALEKPVQSGLIAFAVVFIAWLVFLVVRKLVVRWRAKRRAQQLVQVEAPPSDGAAAASAPWWRFEWLPWRARTVLERRFRRLVALLWNSRLRDRGDPLYVLPWYMLLGREGSGKTSLIRDAGLAAPTIDDAALRSDGDSVDWWLYNEAVVLDTPGTYIGIDEDAPRHPEWSTLLKILARDRVREPLNGVIVTLSAERLGEDVDALFDHGRLVRKRLDELMRAVKLRLPVYLVVSQSDRFVGFESWCRALDRKALEQPMGRVNSAGLAPEAFVRDALATVSDRIKNLMLVLVNDQHIDADLFRLPLAIEGARDALNSFVDGLFQANTFEESPLFQGLYFTGRESSETPSRQAFAHALFAEVLPNDRRVHSTLSKAERAERQFRRLVLSGWGVAMLVAMSVLVATWGAHKSYLQEQAAAVAGTLTRGDGIVENIEIMHAMRGMIRDVDTAVAGWRMPWFGWPGLSTPSFINELRAVYDERVYNDVLDPLNARFDASLDGALREIRGAGVEESELAFLISSLVERINLLAAYADGIRGQELFEYPGPYDNSAVYFPTPVDPLTISRANDLYIQGLLWAHDRDRARHELSLRRQQLVLLLEATGDRMSWLIPWANEQAAGSGFRLADFWGGSGRLDPSVTVEPAFTAAGYQAIQGFLEQLWWAGLDEARFTELEGAFQAYYRERYFAAWENFASQFELGIDSLRGREEWLQAVTGMATERNPYFHLLGEMYAQFAVFEVDDSELPDWVAMVRYYDEMRSFAPGGDTEDHTARNRALQKLGMKMLKKLGPVGKQLAKAGKQGAKTKKQMDKASARSGTSPDERALRLEEAGQRLGEYREVLQDIAFESDIRSVSHASAMSLFSNPDNPGKGDGPEARAHETIQRLQNRIGMATPYNRVFWDLFIGPLKVIEQYYLHESACHVQTLWEERFLVNVEGVPRHRLPELMFGEGGELWTFIDQHLDPFVQRRFRAGYVPRQARGQRLPLRPEFLEFATRGREGMQSREDSYAVRIEALPTSTNGVSVHRPSRTAVQLRCEDGDQDLVNHNFPVEGVFNWNARCGTTVLAIDIGQYTLEKVYSGPHGFPEFLRDYRMGSQRLRPAAFPRYEQVLADYGVEIIDVQFNLSGHESVIAFLDAVPLDPPRTITECWN